mmetsp:Transcript_97425/g.167973  ORF Transcript_97425/g.167973 Transcript_97425/m.167973 type:complete len:587 (-) Transcript_97425:14-1774(-)
MLHDLFELEYQASKVQLELHTAEGRIRDAQRVLDQHKGELEQCRQQFMTVSKPEESRQLEVTYKRLSNLVKTDEDQLLDTMQDKELVADNLQVVIEEIAELRTHHMVRHMDGFEEMSAAFQRIFAKVDQVGEQTLFATPKAVGGTLAYLEWDKQQKDWRAKATSQLQALIGEIALNINGLKIYDSPPNEAAWTLCIHRIWNKFSDQLHTCLLSTLKLLQSAMFGYTKELFFITLKLNAANKLSFSPLVTDVHTIVQGVCDQILKCIQGLPQLPTKLQRAPQTTLPEVDILNAPEVQTCLSCIQEVSSTFPDRIVEFVCQLEDEYKVLWVPGEVAKWKDNSEYLLYLNKLEHQWDLYVNVDCVSIDTRLIHTTILKNLRQHYEAFKEDQFNKMLEADSSDDETPTAAPSRSLPRRVSPPSIQPAQPATASVPVVKSVKAQPLSATSPLSRGTPRSEVGKSQALPADASPKTYQSPRLVFGASVPGTEPPSLSKPHVTPVATPQPAPARQPPQPQPPSPMERREPPERGSAALRSGMERREEPPSMSVVNSQKPASPKERAQASYAVGSGAAAVETRRLSQSRDRTSP